MQQAPKIVPVNNISNGRYALATFTKDSTSKSVSNVFMLVTVDDAQFLNGRHQVFGLIKNENWNVETDPIKHIIDYISVEQSGRVS